MSVEDDDVIIDVEDTEGQPAEDDGTGNDDEIETAEGAVSDDDDDDAGGDEPKARTDRERLRAERRRKRRLQADKAALEKQVRDLGDMVRRLAEGQRSHEEYTASQIASTVEQQYAAAKEQRRRALESGDPDAIDQADDRLYEVRRRKEQLDAVLEAQRRQATQPRQQAAAPNPLRDRWIADNSDWFQQPGYEAETQFVVAKSRELHGRGVNPNDPAHFQALEKEVRRRFPEVFEGDEPKEPRKKPPQTVAAGQRAPAGSAAPKVPQAVIQTWQLAGLMSDPPTKEQLQDAHKYYTESKKGK